MLFPAPGTLREESWGERERGDRSHKRGEVKRGYAFAISGKTASILVFSVAALNGLTM
jgi:hypothetical protein